MTKRGPTRISRRLWPKTPTVLVCRSSTRCLLGRPMLHPQFGLTIATVDALRLRAKTSRRDVNPGPADVESRVRRGASCAALILRCVTSRPRFRKRAFRSTKRPGPLAPETSWQPLSYGPPSRDRNSRLDGAEPRNALNHRIEPAGRTIDVAVPLATVTASFRAPLIEPCRRSTRRLAARHRHFLDLDHGARRLSHVLMARRQPDKLQYQKFVIVLDRPGWA